MPAVQITVSVSIFSPLESVTPVASSAVTLSPALPSTPSSLRASRITVAAWSPIAAPMSIEESTKTTRASVSPKMLRKRSGISVTVSKPVSPPPATTTVLRAAFAGLLAKFLRC
ncbi:hypothetical protein AMPH_11644 [Acinetobacter baumannii]|nr:hypothetical protein AMPH_11644 [Acinetobacter baumannii]